MYITTSYQDELLSKLTAVDTLLYQDVVQEIFYEKYITSKNNIIENFVETNTLSRGVNI